MSEKNKEHVDWKVFIFAAGLIVTTFTAVWATIGNLKEDISHIKVDVATTKNDVSWLRGQWEKMSGQGSVTLKGNLLDRMYENQ